MTNARDAIGQSQVTWDPQTCLNLFPPAPVPPHSPYIRTHSRPLPSLAGKWVVGLRLSYCTSCVFDELKRSRLCTGLLGVCNEYSGGGVGQLTK